MGKAFSTLARSFLIKSSSKLLVTRTGIKARTSLILGRNDENFTRLNLNISEASRPILCSISGGGERLHNVLRQTG